VGVFEYFEPSTTFNKDYRDLVIMIQGHTQMTNSLFFLFLDRFDFKAGKGIN